MNKNTTTMKLTDTQKKYLADNTCSDKKEDFNAIEHAIGNMHYTIYLKGLPTVDILHGEVTNYNHDRDADETEVKGILGEEAWLDGCERATFHRTAVRYSNDGQIQIRFENTGFFRDNGADPYAEVHYDKHHGCVEINHSEGWLRKKKKKGRK